MEFDEERGLYIGQLTSQGGTYQLSGPDRASIDYEVEGILRDEYYQFAQDVGKGKVRSGIGLGLGVAAGIAASGATSGPEKVQEKSADKGFSVLGLAGQSKDSPGEERAKGLSIGSMLDIFTIAMPFAPDIGISQNVIKHTAIGAGLLQAFDLFFKGKKRKKLAVIVGGVLLVAGSKRALKKKIMVHKNRILQRIMHQLRNSIKETERTRSQERQMSERMRERQKNPRKKWVHRMDKSALAHNNDWRTRVDSMRNRLNEKKVHAETGLWAAR